MDCDNHKRLIPISLYRKQVPRRRFWGYLFKQVIFPRLARVGFNNRVRVLLYRLAGVQIAKNVYVSPYCYIDSRFPEMLEIKPHVIISVGAIVIAHDDARQLVGKIVLEENAFVGAGAIIMPGVHIGENAVVGAGAVVIKDVQPNQIVVGSPAKPINHSAPRDWMIQRSRRD